MKDTFFTSAVPGPNMKSRKSPGYRFKLGTNKSAIAQRKPVECLETGDVFDSIFHAASYHGLSKTAIPAAIRLRGGRVGKLTFRFAEVAP